MHATLFDEDKNHISLISDDKKNRVVYWRGEFKDAIVGLVFFGVLYKLFKLTIQ